jgi:hypothetical protein
MRWALASLLLATVAVAGPQYKFPQCVFATAFPGTLAPGFASPVYGSYTSRLQGAGITSAGVAGACVTFVGSGAMRIELGTNQIPKYAAFTIMGWLKPLQWTSSGFGSSRSDGASATSWGIDFVDASDAIYIYTSNGSVATAGLVANEWNNTYYPSNSWTHFAATADGTNLVYYRNGLRAGGAVQHKPNAGTPYLFAFGSFGAYASDQYRGYGDCFVLDNRAWDSSEILSFYRGTLWLHQ